MCGRAAPRDPILAARHKTIEKLHFLRRPGAGLLVGHYRVQTLHTGKLFQGGMECFIHHKKFLDNYSLCSTPLSQIRSHSATYLNSSYALPWFPSVQWLQRCSPPLLTLGPPLHGAQLTCSEFWILILICTRYAVCSLSCCSSSIVLLYTVSIYVSNYGLRVVVK